MASEISEKIGISERKVRDDIVRLINDKVKEVEDKNEIIGKRYGEGDDWLLVTSSLDLAFKIITKILDHNTEYKHYEKVPLEIGIGLGQYDRWARLDGSKLMVETSTIKFLKSHIIDYYREWYKGVYSKSIRSTLIVLTESVYNEMNPFDKDFCKKIEFGNTRTKGGKSSASFFVAETKEVIQRGTIFEFLEKIGKASSSWYYRIDRIFVPPNEYRSIIDRLEKNKVVFLVGDPEIGKTYTAVRVMWEYYSKGYRPIWLSGSEPYERAKTRQIMSDCKITDNSITYFEDPFGKIRFEDREELRRTIGSFLKKIQDSNARVIITSREEVFKEFNKEKLSQSDLQTFAIEMRLMKPSYNKEEMETILLDWAKEFECIWLQIENLRSLIVVEAIKRLTTPLSLREFALASREHDDFNVIYSLIKEKSKEVKQAFAEEIAKMSKERIMFLSLIYILRLLEPEKIKAIYIKECREFGLDWETSSFEYLLDHFKPRINLSEFIYRSFFHFTHPSYEEGLVVSWNRLGVRQFFLKLVNELSKNNNPFVRGSCGFCLIENFAELSFKDEVIALIKATLQDKSVYARAGVAEAIHYFFNEIPSSLALELLEKMANDRHREIRAKALATIGENFKKFPMQESLKFISRGLEDRAAWTRLEAVRDVRINLDRVPEALVVKALSCCRELCNYKGWFISYSASITYGVFEKESRLLKGKHITRSLSLKSR